MEDIIIIIIIIIMYGRTRGGAAAISPGEVENYFAVTYFSGGRRSKTI